MSAAMPQPLWAAAAGTAFQPRPGILANLLALVILACGGAAWWFEYPFAIVAAFPVALWLAGAAPERLVTLLVLTAPTFPVARVAEEGLNVQRVTAKGAFLSIDDPMIAALAAAAAWRWLSRRGSGAELFPSALAALALLYPCVIALNLLRLEPGQAAVSFLAYLKWLQYACVIFLIPAVIPARAVPDLLRLYRRSLVLGLVLSAGYASYEFAVAIRTGSYTSAARFPRASGFFGSLDPSRFGASEDPVNFGCYTVVAGSIALAYSARADGRGVFSGTAGAFAAGLGLLLSVSRTPILAALAAFQKVQRLRSGRVLLAVLPGVAALAGVYLLMPGVWQTSVQRFGAVLDWDANLESSAESRWTIALNAPVFTIDSYWLAGHGYSSYRFVAEEHLAGITRGVSRSLYNFLITVWYDAGLAGTVLWILVFVQLFRRFRTIREKARHSEIQALAHGLTGAAAGILVAAMFGETPYNWRVMGFFYASAGVCLAAYRWERRLAAR
jgi:hypothetical protein